VDEFDQERPAAKETIDLKFRAVFSHRRATRLKRLSLPTPCSMRARACISRYDQKGRLKDADDARCAA
jgi:hypothetical protein